MLTSLSSLELAVVVAAILFGATGLGIWIGRVLSRRKSGLKEPLGIMQAALVGLVALLLAFGLTMAVGRYQARRDAVVLEANAIGTTYLRAQTLAEPMRSESLELLKRLRRRAHRVVGLGAGLGTVPRPPSQRVGRDPEPPLDPRRRRLEPGADGQCSAPLRRDAERDDRCPHDPRRRARQPHPVTGALAADPRQRPRARGPRACSSPRTNGA